MTEKDISIDWEKCLKQANNDPEMAKTLLTMFMNDLDEAFPHIQQAWEEENYSVLQAHIHKLYGGSCYTGIPKMTAILSKLEATMKHPTTSAIGPLLQEFDDARTLLADDFNSDAFPLTAQQK